jgi:Family of unknown function (DUF5984)
MSLVEFEMRPVADIEPWGSVPNLSLSWFGLSDGSYHLEAGETRLLEYVSVEGRPRFVEYPLARLHEDLISMLPDVLETVPPDIARQFRNNSISATIQRLRQARSAQVDADPGLDLAVEALGARGLDTGYLSPSAGIWIWATDERAIIEWDNRDRFHEGRPVWTAQIGRWEMSVAEFLHELQSFDRRLMDAMGARARAAVASWTRPEVEVDVNHLEAEQIERGTWLASTIQHGRREIDWTTVRHALSRTQSEGSA